MRTYLDCFPCVLKQALDAARVATPEETLQRRILNRVMDLLGEMDQDLSPPQVAQRVHRLVREVSQNPDPYRAGKAKTNEHALRLLPALRDAIEGAKDPLDRAVRLALAGNVIDFGAGRGSFELKGEIPIPGVSDFGVYDYAHFREDLRRARSILYLGDNAGEIALDRLLVERILDLCRADLTFVVRGKPVLNDATLEDARFVGLDRIVRVIDNGSDAPGTVLSEVTPEVRRLFEATDMIIAKGQGNYETLSDEPGNIYFLLKVKCPVLARNTAVEAGKFVLARRRQARVETGASRHE